MDEGQSCIEFKRKSGSAWLFYEMFYFITKELDYIIEGKKEKTGDYID